MRPARKKLLFNLLVLALFGAWVMTARFFQIPCVFLRFTGYPCPGCGMTRAAACVLRLDFAGALRYHPMVFAMPLVLWLLLAPEKPERKTLRRVLWILIGAGFLANWVVRLASAV